MSVAEPLTTAQFAALQPPKRYLFGPGPTMVDPRVYTALSKPIVGHLDAYFIQVMSDVQQLVKMVYGTSEASTLVISGTGSAGMEAAISNFVEPG
ncbi:MAG TPA: alanine--glyoxylate aminotransferase family protein, partial [Candidatus Binatia bacterium]|nr:alanine--glyoxylate aminotransferase family protein [Candidatus Binatia bacterium]